MKCFLLSWWIASDIFSFTQKTRTGLHWVSNQRRQKLCLTVHNCSSCMWEVSSQGLSLTRRLPGGKCSDLLRFVPCAHMAVSSQHDDGFLHLNRLYQLMLCSRVASGTSSPSTQGFPQLPFPKAFGEARSRTWVVDLCPLWQFLCFCMQMVCRMVTLLKEAVSHFMVWLPTVIVLFWIVLLFSPLSNHTHAIFASQVHLEPVLVHFCTVLEVCC